MCYFSPNLILIKTYTHDNTVILEITKPINFRTMDLFVKYNFVITCKAVLKDQLDKLNISYQINGMGNIYFPNRIQNDKYELLHAALGQYGIDIIDNKKSIL